MALKHRQNKSQKQRIVMFNCSPIEEDEKNLVKLAKKMKKSGISIDIIAFGELSDDTTRKLRPSATTYKAPKVPTLLPSRQARTCLVTR